MLDPIVLAAALFAVAVTVFFWQRQRTSGKRPPGPLGWPFLGNLNFFLSPGPQRHNKFMETGKKYGGMFTLKIGEICGPCVTSYRYFREAMIDKAWTFADRPADLRFPELNTGILTSGVDEDSREIRRFTLVSLRSFGFGKADMQNIILTESDLLIDEFRRTKGSPFNPRNALTTATANIISALLIGKRFHHEEAGFAFIGEKMSEALKLVNSAMLVTAFPLLKLWPHKDYRVYLDNFRDTKKFITGLIMEHEKTRAPGNPRDFVDAWLDRGEADKNAQSLFTRDRLVPVLIDLFGGGFDTSATTLQWALLLLLHHPSMQDRIHREMDDAIERTHQISWDDRDKLPYTEAFIWETLRLYPVFPFAAPHQSTEPAKLGEYEFPAGTRIVFHLFSIHRDPELWKAPEEFQPERFVENGKLKLPDFHVAFSAGRRSCIGEQLARKELFLLFANLLHCFKVMLPAGIKQPGKLTLNRGVTLQPSPYGITVVPRF